MKQDIEPGQICINERGGPEGSTGLVGGRGHEVVVARYPNGVERLETVGTDQDVIRYRVIEREPVHSVIAAPDQDQAPVLIRAEE